MRNAVCKLQEGVAFAVDFLQNALVMVCVCVCVRKQTARNSSQFLRHSNSPVTV
jgi:hypothetical protein